jgi:HPt (histidine-containing phosphotransfer) domain-containing protein
MALQRACQRLPDRLSSPDTITVVTSEPAFLSVIDKQMIEDIREMGGAKADAILTQIMDRYFKDSPLYLQQIQTAIANADAEGLAKAAHSLGSSSATLGAMAFAQDCKQLENKARSQNLTDIEADGIHLGEKYEIVKVSLQKLLPKS